MPNDTLPKLTVAELALAERIALFLVPTLREAMVMRAGKPADDAVSKFVREYRDALRAGEHAHLLRLASRFVESQPKE